ncbi:MAG: DAK2 domain-containing protein [Kiritimatiellaeota bacterium]|nr:DAK2 domain-containing protein [Kiritimatiellota bacterium]
MTLQTFKSMVAAAGTDIRADEKRFSELDAAAGGDGDHGTAIVTAFNAMAKADGADFKSYLKALSDALQNEACGSTSTLYGAWLQGMSDAAPEGAVELDPEAVAAMFTGGLEELGFTTRARVGDKTLMDALIPATDALAAAMGDGIAAMFKAAAEAASKGSEATAAMRAKFGRAKNLGDRSIGPVDAGSASMACIFNAFAREGV